MTSKVDYKLRTSDVTRTSVDDKAHNFREYEREAALKRNILTEISNSNSVVSPRVYVESKCAITFQRRCSNRKARKAGNHGL